MFAYSCYYETSNMLQTRSFDHPIAPLTERPRMELRL